MRAARTLEIVFLLLAAGCSSVKAPVPVVSPQTSAPQSAAESKTETPVGTLATPQNMPPPPVPMQGGVPPVQVAPPPTLPIATPSATQSVAKAVEPSAKGIAKAPPPPVQAPKKESTAPDVAKPKEPTLDLASLEMRLKDTKAIGVLTKISLKNQVDDLLGQFRAFYAGKLKTTLAELRQPYELLVLKVLSLLQDSDTALAAAIVASREAIWGILADPAKFAKI
jgi:hypothetical protein